MNFQGPLLVQSSSLATAEVGSVGGEATDTPGWRLYRGLIISLGWREKSESF